MPTFTITAVSDQVKDVPLPRGDFKSYKMHLRDQQGVLSQGVEWFRKASSPAPQQGDQIEGEIEQGPYGPKFKAAQKAFGGGGGRRDPQESAHIRRQHSHTTALRYWELLQARGELHDASFTALLGVIDKFYTDSGQAKP